LRANLIQKLFGYLGHHLGLAGSQYVVQPRRGVGIWWVPASDLVCQRDFLRVGMLDGEPLEYAALFDDVYRAPVGEGGHGEAGHAGEGLVVIKGRGEHGARPDEEALRLLGPVLPGDVPEVHRKPFPGRVSPSSHPSAVVGEPGLELGSDALPHGAPDPAVGLTVDSLGKFFPHVLAEQLLPGAAPELLDLAVDVE
jgi:hypothetical protein